MKSHEFTRPYQQNPIRRGDTVVDKQTGTEYRVYGVEGSEIVINSDGDTLPEHRPKKIKKPA